MTVNLVKTDETITFAALANKTFGDAPFSVSATASSGLAVSLAASGACTVVGSLVTITGAGSCTITASQAGNSNYNAAPNVPQTFSIANPSTTQDVKLTLVNVGGLTSGQRGAYVVIVANTGTVATSGTLTFTNTLPAGLTYVALTLGWTCSIAGQKVTCTYAHPLAAHGTTALALFVRVTAHRGTVLTDTGTVTPLDATPADNTASVRVTVR